MKEPEFVKVRIDLPESDLHDYASETLWAEPKGLDLYILGNSPVYSNGYSFLDTVLAVSVEDDFPNVVEVVKPSGHSTIRIFKLENTNDEEFDSHLQELVDLGGTYEGMHNVHFALDIAPEILITPILDVLEKGEEANVWNYEYSNFVHISE